MNELMEQKAKELGQLITETEEYKLVKQKQAAMLEDEQAMALLKEFQRLQKENNAKHQKGQLTNADMKAVEQAELNMLENKLISEFHEAQTSFQLMLNQVMRVIIDTSK